MALNVIGGKRDGHEIGDAVLAQLFAGDEGLGEVELIAVGCGRAAYELVELRRVFNGCFFFGLQAAVRGVEGRGPGGQMFHVISGGGEDTAGLIDPVGPIGGLASGQNRSAVLERDAENL